MLSTIAIVWTEIDFIKRVDKGRITTVKDFEADVSSVSVSIRSDEGLTLETSAFKGSKSWWKRVFCLDNESLTT